MVILAAPNHKERLLKALTHVPIATTKQLATLNDSLDPLKKASSILRELENEKLVRSDYHGREKVWRLSPKGRKALNITPTKLSKAYDHHIAVGSLYFTQHPARFLFEPRETFTHAGREYVWAPDCIFVRDKKLYACEVQLSPLSAKRWAAKWKAWNLFFNHGYFKEAKFQEWSSKTIMPQFLVFTGQQGAREGFEIRGRELIIAGKIKSP